MPAAAVIPAPIAYIKVVAVKKLVVEFRVPLVRTGLGDSSLLMNRNAINLVLRGIRTVTLKKLECLKQA